MKLLFCCENYPPSVGGVQEVVRQIAERLARAGHDVTVATGAHPDRPAQVRRNGVFIQSFSIKGNWVRGMHGPLNEYRKFVLQGEFDVVCIKAAQQWAFDALVEVLPDIKARKVFIPCGFSALFQAGYRTYFENMPRWLRACDALIFYASDYRDIQFSKAHGLNTTCIIPNGADEREFDGADGHDFRLQHAIAKDELLLLTVGSVTGLKGHWEVARAFEIAQFSQRSTLVINGNNPGRTLKGRLKQLALNLLRRRPSLESIVGRINAEQGAQKRVLFCDLPRDELVRAFKASDLFVFASHVEYSPLVLFEAAAAGTAFLSSPAGNAAEIAAWTNAGEVFPCDGNKDAFLVPDPVVLARHMEAMTSDRGYLRALGERGRDSFMNGGFTWEKIALQYEEIFAAKTLPPARFE